MYRPKQQIKETAVQRSLSTRNQSPITFQTARLK